MRLPLLTLMLILMLPLSANAAPVERAEKLLESGKFRQARIELLRLLDEDSQEVRVHYLLARTYDALGEFNYALRALERAEKLTRDSVWKRKFRILRGRIQTESRRKVLDEGLAQSTATESRVLGRARHGRLLEMQRQFAAAMREYQSLQKIYPGSRVGWYLAGRLKLAEGRRDEAAADMRKVFELAPDDTSAVNLLTDYGFSPAEIENLGFQGEFDYERIERFAAERLYRRGLQLHHQNNRDTAAVLERAAELNPDHLKARSLLMEELYRNADLDGAFDEAGEILRLDQKNNRAREIRYLVLQRWGYRRDAVRELQEGLKQDTDAVALRLYLGLDLRNRKKQKVAAYHELARVIELDPENRDAADALQEMGLRHNQIRKLGYKGILLPVKFHPLDKVFVPGKKVSKPETAAVRPPRPPQAAQFQKKGRYARRKRRELPDTSEVALGTGEVTLTTGEIALAATHEVYVEPPVELDDLLDLASVLPDSELRARIREQTVRRLFETLDEDGRKAYARKLEFEIENSCTEPVTLRDVQTQRLQFAATAAPAEPAGADAGAPGTQPVPPVTSASTPAPPATPPASQPPVSRPNAAGPGSPQQTGTPASPGGPGSKRPWWKFWNRNQRPAQPRTSEVNLSRQVPPQPGQTRATAPVTSPASRPVQSGQWNRRRWTRQGTRPVSLTVPPVRPTPVTPQTPATTTAVTPVTSSPATPVSTPPPAARSTVPATPVTDAVRPATPNAWWHWGTNQPAPQPVRPVIPSTEPAPPPAEPADPPPAPEVEEPEAPPVIQPGAAAPVDVE